MAFTTSSTHRRCNPEPYIATGIRYVYLGLHSILWGTIKRIIDLPILVAGTFYPHSKITNFFWRPKDAIEVNAQTIVARSFGSEEAEQMGHLLLTRLQRIENVKLKIGLKQEVRLFLHPGLKKCAASFGSVYSKEIGLILNIGYYSELPDDQFDFLIAHELHHIWHNDLLQDLARNTCILTVKVVLGYCFTPWAIPLIEVLALPYEIWRGRRIERTADLASVAVLGTSKGAEALCRQSIKGALKQREEEIQSLGSPLATNISEEGNDENDLFHPPMTSRLAYCAQAGRQLSQERDVEVWS